MGMYLDEFIQKIRTTKNLSEKTIKAYRSDLKGFFAEIGNVGAVTLSEIFNYIDGLKAQGLKDTSIKRKLISIKQFLDYLCKTKHLTENPMREISFPFKKERRLPKTLEVKEVRALINCLKTRKTEATTPFALFQTTRDLCLIDLMLSTGIRVGEAVALTLDDIVHSEHTILIHGKGRKQRLLYISCQDTWNNLKDWLRLRKERGINCASLFVNREHSPLSVYGAENIFSKYRDLTGINAKATPHFLRHTFATNLLANGADLRSVQEIMGHASVSTTEIYTEVTINRKKKVLSKYNYRNKLLL